MRYLLRIHAEAQQATADALVGTADLDSARATAVRALQSVMADRRRQGTGIPSEWTVQIVNEAGDVIENISPETAVVEAPVGWERHRRLYLAAHHAYLFLAPDLGILEANPSYLNATMTDLATITHRHMFDIFPDNPADNAATGERNLRESFKQVLERKQPHVMPRQRYDIRHADGTWEERYWDPVNFPLLDENGEIDVIVHHVEDVTCLIVGQRNQLENLAAQYMRNAKDCELKSRQMLDWSNQKQMLDLASQWRNLAQDRLRERS